MVAIALSFVCVAVVEFTSVTAAQAADGQRVIAVSDAGRVLYRMIACELPASEAKDCHRREQQRLDRRLHRQWINEAMKMYAVSLTAADEAAVRAKVDAERTGIERAAAHFRALATAALKVRRGEDIARVRTELPAQDIRPSELDWELEHLPTVKDAERMAAKDFLADELQAARDDFAQPFILGYLRQIVAKRAAAEGVPFGLAEERFWSNVANSIHTRMIDPAFALPNQKGILVDP